MAARQLQRRFQSLLFGKQQQHPFLSSPFKEPSYVSAKLVLNRYDLHRRNRKASADGIVTTNKDDSAMSKLKTSPTYKVCETRSVKAASRISHETVIMLAMCDGGEVKNGSAETVGSTVGPTHED